MRGQYRYFGATTAYLRLSDHAAGRGSAFALSPALGGLTFDPRLGIRLRCKLLAAAAKLLFLLHIANGLFGCLGSKMSDQAISRSIGNQPASDGSEKNQEDASAQDKGKGSSENLSWWSTTDDKRAQQASGWLYLVVDVLRLDDIQALGVAAGIPAKKEDGRALPIAHKKAETNDNSDWVFLISGDTLEVAGLSKLRFPNRKILVHSFADPDVPGGEFLQGKSTQEEALCIRTTLMASIKPEIVNNSDRELYPLKEMDYLYSENVVVMARKPLVPPDFAWYAVDVISLPADKPMNNGELAYDVTDWIMMSKKITCVLRAAIKHGCDSVVIGAFGVCVGHPPEDVAKITQAVLLDGEEDWRANGIKSVFIAIKDRAVGLETWSAFWDAFELQDGVYVDENSVDVLNVFYFKRKEGWLPEAMGDDAG